MEKPICTVCGNKVQWRGSTIRNILGIRQKTRRYQCTKCGAWGLSVPRNERPVEILLLDIEILPGRYYSFTPKPEYLQPESMDKDWSIVCWSAKWLFDSKIIGASVTPEEARNGTEGSILEEIHKLVDKANIVVTQNGIKFDMKKLNTKWLLYGYKPPSPYLNVDTLVIAKSKFDFTYNRLDELGEKLGIGRKSKMELSDWIRCSEGSQEHIDKMLAYCKRDVAPLLEDVYLHFLPWIDNHPNMNIFTDGDQDVCRNCASTNLSWNTQYATPQGLWQGWRCNNCGAVGRGTSKDRKEKSTSIK